MKKILVTGYKGMLGSLLYQKLLKAGYDVKGVDLPEIDLTDNTAVAQLLAAENFAVIYNCAAFTNVDLCETEYDKAYAVNALAVKNLAQNAGKSVLVHISTDYVFNGLAQAPYDTEETRAPVSAYGKTKAAGEQFLEEAGCKYFIVRTAWLYGRNGKNFVDTILKLADEKDEIKVVNDQCGAPTYTEDLAAALVLFADCHDYGRYHFTNAGQTTWFGLAKEIVRLAGKTVKVLPCTTAEFPRPAIRPAYSVLDLSKTERVLQIKIADWQNALQRYLNKEE